MRPNVIFIYPDEMRYDTTSFSGNKLCKTPAIDSLYENGAAFTSAYTSFPLCCPFRSSIMTGKYAHKTGIYCNHYKIPLNQDFLPKIMKEAGYYTGWVGKWHLNGGNKYDPVEKEYQLGFDEFTGYSRGHHYVDSVYYKGEDPTPYKSEKFEPIYQTDQMLNFIDSAISKDKPFLGMMCYGLPHHPVDMQPDYYKNMFDPNDIELPETVPLWKAEKSKIYRAKYLGMVRCVDDQIQRLIDGLKERNIFDNTIFIVVSDHGDMCEEHNIEDKTVAFESSTHVPFFISCPNLIKPKTEISQIVDPSVGVAPTILDLCDIKIPESMQGQSLKNALINGHDDTLNDYSYYQVLKTYEKVADILFESDVRPYPERGIRTKDYLYVESCGTPFMFFDLTKDKNEMYNGVNDFRHFKTIKELHLKLNGLMEQYGDDWSVGLVEFPEYHPMGKISDDHYNEVYSKAIYE